MGYLIGKAKVVSMTSEADVLPVERTPWSSMPPSSCQQHCSCSVRMYGTTSTSSGPVSDTFFNGRISSDEFHVASARASAATREIFEKGTRGERGWMANADNCRNFTYEGRELTRIRQQSYSTSSLLHRIESQCNRMRGRFISDQMKPTA